MSENSFDLDDILNEIISKNVGADMADKVNGISRSEKKAEPAVEIKKEIKTEEPKKAEAPKAPAPAPQAEAPKAPAPAPQAEAPKVPAPAPQKAEAPKVPAPAPQKAAEPKAPAPAPQKAAAPKAPAPAPQKAAEPKAPVPAPQKADAPKTPAPAAKPAQPKPAPKPELELIYQETPVETTDFDLLPDDEKDRQYASPEKIELSKVDAPAKKKVKKKKKWRKTRKGKIFTTIISLLLVAVIGAGGGMVWYLNDALNKITTNDQNRIIDNPTIDEWNGMETFSESFATINEDARVSSYRDMVKNWYYNGEPVKSSNVINVMLIGEDTRGSEIAESGTRADSAIIASVNTQTGEIILTSILRDAYVYYEKTIGDNTTGRFDKINSAMSIGGVNCYINAVERMFKVNIDNYAIVNFTSFQKIIDSLGGVNITMTNAEIREINNHPKTYGDVKIEGNAGDHLLTGEQALAYCRIRHIDSDNVRADRQKTVLLQLFKKMKDASTLKLAEVVTTLLPYVKTGYSKSEVLSIGRYALSHGWISYKTVTYTVPTNETNTDGTAITTCKGGMFYGTWIWKIDCPLASQILQNKIYGKTSIVLAENRPSFSGLSDY